MIAKDIVFYYINVKKVYEKKVRHVRKYYMQKKTVFNKKNKKKIDWVYRLKNEYENYGKNF